MGAGHFLFFEDFAFPPDFFAGGFGTGLRTFCQTGFCLLSIFLAIMDGFPKLYGQPGGLLIKKRQQRHL